MEIIDKQTLCACCEKVVYSSCCVFRPEHGSLSATNVVVVVLLLVVVSAKAFSFHNRSSAAVREADSLYSFKRKLKIHLFTLCFNESLSVFMYFTNFCNAFPVR